MTTVGIPMVGDPRIEEYPRIGPVRIDPSADRLLTRRACQYAAEMARAAGALSGDLSGLDAYVESGRTVVFVAADRTQAEVARFTIPERVMRFDPFRKPLRLADQAEGA